MALVQLAAPYIFWPSQLYASPLLSCERFFCPLAYQITLLDAYGWPHTLTDEQILERLLALNLARAGGVG